MASKNRTIRNFISLVPDYCRSKCEKHETLILKHLRVMSCMENLAIFETSQPDVIEFFTNVRELLKTVDRKSAIGWKTVEMLNHMCSDQKICEFLSRMEFVPILSEYLHNKLEIEKAILVLSVIELLTEGIIVERTGLWLGKLLKYLTCSILEKNESTLPHLVAVMSNFCLDNYVVINELHKDTKCEEMMPYLGQLQAIDSVVQLHVSQIFFSLLSFGKITPSLLGTYIKTVIDLMLEGVKKNQTKLIKRCSSIMLWMSRDRLIVGLLHSDNFQELLQGYLETLVPFLTESTNSGTINSGLLFMANLLRTSIISNKKFTETFIPQLIPLLHNDSVSENLLELMADLLENSNTLNLIDGNLEQLFSKVVEKINQFQNIRCKKSCKTLSYALQILQKIYKSAPSHARVTSCLPPETFVQLVGNFIVFLEADDRKADSSLVQNCDQNVTRYAPEATSIVVEALTLLAQIACRGGDYLSTYSYLTGQPNVQQCIAASILQGDCHLKEASLALINTLGFSTDNVSGVSQALSQQCIVNSGGRRPSSAAEDVAYNAGRSLLNCTLPPSQTSKLDNLLLNMKNQEKFWEEFRKCDVFELMELQLERREREERRLRLDLDAAQQEINELKIGRLQIQAENSRMMSMLLSKSDLAEKTADQNRGLSRRLEQTEQQFIEANARWTKELEKFQKKKENLEKIHAESTAQLQAQVEAGKKQNLDLIQKSQELEAELERFRKKNSNLKAHAEKQVKELEAKNQELQESQASSDSLKKSLRKKEKEGEEKDKEIAQLNKAVKKAEIIRQDLETRLVESEQTAQETKEKLTKLEKIQEFIFELSSGKKKLFEEGKG